MKRLIIPLITIVYDKFNFIGSEVLTYVSVEQFNGKRV